jgi:hypothetical protein
VEFNLVITDQSSWLSLHTVRFAAVDDLFENPKKKKRKEKQRGITPWKQLGSVLPAKWEKRKVPSSAWKVDDVECFSEKGRP